MRRIIERKVTVVTTTTWTISWQEDSPPHSPEEDSVSPAESLPQPAQTPSETQPEPKEAD